MHRRLKTGVKPTTQGRYQWVALAETVAGRDRVGAGVGWRRGDIGRSGEGLGGNTGGIGGAECSPPGKQPVYEGNIAGLIRRQQTVK